MRVALKLLLLAALCFAPFFCYPEWRGTEARRVQIAVEMLESGDYVVPRLWGEETFAKPPFYYWLLAGTFRVFGVHPWSARLPSVLGFWLLALVAYRWLARRFSASTAAIGAAGILVAPVVAHDVPFAEIDPVFAVLTVWSIFCLAEGVFEHSRKRVLLAGLLGGLAVLTKGPPYLMFCIGPLWIWWKHSRLRGFALYLPLVLGFYLAYKLVLDQRPVSDDVGQVAVQESLGRLAFWQPRSLLGIPAHVLNFVLVIGLPLSPWGFQWWRKTRREGTEESCWQNFLIFGAIGGAAVLLFSVDRATRYLLPAVPLLICGLAPLAGRQIHREGPPGTLVRRGTVAFGVVAGAATIAMPWIPFPYPGTTWIAVLALGCVALVVHSTGQLVRFVLVAPVVIALAALPDRLVYAAHAADFTPPRAAILARECVARGIGEVHTYGHVNTSILLELKARMPPSFRIHADMVMRHPPRGRWLLAVDRGTRGFVTTPGYRDVLRVQVSRSKSLSLRERM